MSECLPDPCLSFRSLLFSALRHFMMAKESIAPEAGAREIGAILW